MAHLVEVFAQVKRVLRADGTLWVVISDSYASSGVAGPMSRRSALGVDTAGVVRRHGGVPGPNPKMEGQVFGRAPTPVGLPPKSLLGIPWRLAFALQDDGWLLRQEIIWSKLAPMPESVGDRCTRSHEFVFMLAKGPQYFYDATSIAEPCATADDRRNRADYRPQRERDVGGRSDGFTRSHGAMTWPAAGRNKRSVWTIGPQPLHEEHYAAFPEKLVAPMVLAGTSEAGCCPRCRAPWRRVVEREKRGQVRPYRGSDGRHPRREVSPGQMDTSARTTLNWDIGRTTTGWEPSCRCDAGPPVPCRVLDCFGGSGTVGLVSRKLGRNAVLIEMNAAYAALAQKRVDSVPDTLFSAASISADGAAAR